MTDEFLKYDMQTVFRDTTKDGLLFQFLTEYKKEFKTGSLNPSCKTCRSEMWNNYINLFKPKEMASSKYVLKAKYNGINLGATGQPLRNGEFTDKQALELLKKHPKGVDLFEVIPEKKTTKKTPKKVLDEKS
tara:strand:- start:15808 stop:16203 length:396 start_codon:yes stop_codon:yes gene_type:complete